MKLPRIIIILYQNEAHSELATQKYIAMMKKGGDLERILRLIDDAAIPIVWSAQGIDYTAMMGINYENLFAMKSNRNITHLSGLFTHALPSMYPFYLDRLINEDFNALQRNGIQRSPIGMLPEFDMFPSGIPILNTAGWSYVLLQEGVNTYYDFREGIASYDQTSTAPLGVIRDELGNELRAITTQGPRLRGDYLKMLRGLVTPSDLVDKLIAEAELSQKAGSPIMPFLIDLEAIQINDAMPFFEDYITELARAHHNGRIQLAGFDDAVNQALEDRFAQGVPEIELALRDKPKWKYTLDEHRIADRIAKNVSLLDPYLQKALLWACVSDHYSAQFSKKEEGLIAKLPVMAKSGNLIPDAVKICNDRQRVSEVLHALWTVEHKLSVVAPSEIALSDASRERMFYLDRALRY